MTDRELEQRLRAWYQTEVGEDETASLLLRRDVAAIPWSSSRPGRWFGRDRGIRVLAAAALLLVGGAVAATGSGLVRLPSLVPPKPVPSTAVAPTPSYLEESTSPAQPRTPGWSVTGRMITARFDHTATLLRDGRVLVAGGSDGTDGLASAEVYNPATGSWTATGSMGTARSHHTATLLADGRVLVTGGSSNTDGLASAELYDPAAGSWTPTGNMGTARSHHTATLLPDGKVLVTGGYGGPSGLLASAELYDPATGSWTATGSMGTPRYGHEATLLLGGTVLVTGGAAEGGGGAEPLTSAELYDPASRSWTWTGAGASEWEGHTATLLPGGDVFVAKAGWDPRSNVSVTSAALYDPVSGIWTAGRSTVRQSAQMATLLFDGKVLVLGSAVVANAVIGPRADLFDPVTGSWTGAATPTLQRNSFTATLLPDGRVLVAGGRHETPNTVALGELASAELYDLIDGQ